MRILIFSPFYPPHVGGLESHSDEFNKHLSQSGVKISVFTPRLPIDSPERELRHNEVSIIRFPAFEPIHNYPLPQFWCADFWRQWNALLEQDCDIVISRTRFFFPSLMALRYAHKRNLPLLHIEHGSDFAKFNGRLKTALGEWYDRIFGRFILRFADHIIGNSQASADFVKKLSGRTDCQVIYRGSNIKGIEGVEPEHTLRETYRDKTIIAFIGRLIDGKGAHDLIAAIAELKRNDIICFIIGGGPEEERLKKLISEYRLADQVLIFGNVSFDKAIGILKTADIVVNPSYTEGLPTSVTEAALCQKAIIATNVGGTPEVISGNDDGYLIEPKNVKKLGEKLSDLIDHPEKRLAFGQNAYREVRNKFDWDESAKKYLTVFSEILENRKV
jgi:glycosyltransferase involved in cell wall biosynthesis